MNHFLCALHFCLVVLVVDVQSRISPKYPKYPREEKKEYDCSSQQEPTSSDCDSDNEVNTDSRQHDYDSKERSDAERTKTPTNPTSWKVVRYASDKEVATQIGEYFCILKLICRCVRAIDSACSILRFKFGRQYQTNENCMSK